MCDIAIDQSNRLMNKPKKKLRYVRPGITETDTLLSSIICSSVIFNIQIQELDDVDPAAEDEAEKFFLDS